MNKLLRCSHILYKDFKLYSNLTHNYVDMKLRLLYYPRPML